MSVKSFPAIASRSYNDGTKQGSWPNPVPLDVWQSDTGLAQGRYVREVWIDYEISGESINLYDGPFYGIFDFGSGAGRPSELAGKIIDSVRLRLTRYDDSPGSDAGVTTTVYATNLTSVPGAGAHSPDGQITGGGVTSPAMTKGQTIWVNIPSALWNAVIAGKCLCLYTGTSRLSRHYGIEGSSTQEPLIEFTYHDPVPALITPAIAAIGKITEDKKLFDWSNSSDSANYFALTRLMYEWQITYNNGSTWGDGIIQTGLTAIQEGDPRIITAEGVSQYEAALRTMLDLESAQYYYNNQCKIRVRAKTPAWTDGQTYYSAWTTSPAFEIDYRIVPTAPTPTPSKADPYEGETISFTMSLPDAYNTHDADGAINVLTYTVELRESPPVDRLLISGSAPVNSDPPVLSYTVGELTTDMNDRVTAVKAICTDTEEQPGSYSDDVPFTIRRFHRPRATATISARLANTCTVNVVVIDTGYGGIQRLEQIQKIQYKGVPGAADWTDATLKSSWAGDSGAFINSFDLGDHPNELDAGTQYDLLVRAVSKPPYGEGTLPAGRDGLEYGRTILEYLPGLALFKRPTETNENAAKSGGYMQAGIVGDNPNTPANKGSLVVQHDIDAGGDIRKNGENVLTESSLPAISAFAETILDDTSAAAMRATIGAAASTQMSFTQSGVSYNNSWADYGGSFAFGYMKDSMGFVHLRGLLTGGTTTSGTVMANLPASYRPASQTQYFPVACNGSSYAPGVVSINGTTGNITLYSGSGWVSFNGITFYAG